jgi:transmembrane sensor
MCADRELIGIEEEAATWMIERDRGLSRARKRELARWLAADARHAGAFHALAETWALIAEVQPAEAPANVINVQRRQHFLIPLSLAAAALLVVCLGWWRLANAGLHDGAGQFAIASATDIGVLRTVTLPDGSVIQLNTDSAVDVRYSVDERRVSLTRGEAHFTVAKNRERPFIVSVAGVDVRVVGTVFNVRLRPEKIDVLVTEGKVQVDRTGVSDSATASSAEATQAELSAGQKLSIDLQSKTAPVATRAELSPVEIKQALAWQSRRLDFDAARLEEIVVEMNRYNRHKLVVADSRLTERRFGGSFPAGDYDTIVRMLEANFGVVAERKKGETWLRLKGP